MAPIVNGVQNNYGPESHSARSADVISNVEDYASQLKAYRRMLGASRHESVEVGLMYVRGLSWVRVG